MLAEFIPNDSASMRNQSPDNILLKSQGEIEIGPSFVSIFDLRKPENEIVDILNIAFPFTFVAEAQYHTRYLDIGKGHEF